jgi:hypothetical protein
MRPLLQLAVLCTAVAVFATPASAATPAKPTVKVIKKLLKEHYLGSYPTDYPTYRYDWRLVAPVKYGAPRRGTYLADGVPANTKTMVFPVLAKSRYTVCNPDGTFKRDPITAKYVFFRDEFREWTFRIKDEDRTVGTSAAGACPIS